MNSSHYSPLTSKTAHADQKDCQACQSHVNQTSSSALFHTPEKSRHHKNLIFSNDPPHRNTVPYKGPRDLDYSYISPIPHHTPNEEHQKKSAPRPTFKSLFPEDEHRGGSYTTRTFSPIITKSPEQEKRSAQGIKSFLSNNNSPSIESCDTPQKPSPLRIETIKTKSEREKLLKESETLIREFRATHILDKQGGYQPNVQKQEFAEGCSYEGNLAHERRDGKGIYIYENGDAYMGDWVENYFHGVGTYFFANGERYEGQLEDSMKHGKGTYHYLDFKRYTGDWVYDKKQGKGVYDYYGMKEKYEGDFYNGKKHGMGTYYYASGEKFVGQWKNGEKVVPEMKKVETEVVKRSHNVRAVVEERPIYTDLSRDGRGMIRFPNGDTFEGTWASGKLYGIGTYTYSHGGKYEGEWKDSLKTGKGTLILANGDKYLGEWSRDDQNGQGVLIHADGDRYEGEFKHSKKHGFGTMRFRNGDIYLGQWEDGHRSGKGLYKFHNGDTYEGFWQNDKKNGKGTYTWQDGSKYDGTWAHDAINQDELRYSGFFDANRKSATFQHDARQVVLIK